MKKVFVFTYEDCVVSKGEFDQWCAFAETELEAKLHIQTRYKIQSPLILIQSFEDRRKPNRRYNEERREVLCKSHGIPLKSGPFYKDVCEKCEPFQFEKCAGCNATRLYCCC